MDALESTRIRLTLHYDGSAFHGWQVQSEHRTVQGDLEAALSRLANRPCAVIGSGRTDTGVHATGQVACVDVPPGWRAENIRRALNAILPHDVWIEAAAETALDFHPRFDAVRRTYRYEVGLRAESASPFHLRWCWPLGESIDRDLLQRAADVVVGEHSFEAFSKTGQPERGDRCHVFHANWSNTRLGVHLTITADRYLHRMVRYLVGTMIDIARDRRRLHEMARLLANDPDVTTSPPAPAHGLFLHRVEYPGDVPVDQPIEAPTTRSTTPT